METLTPRDSGVVGDSAALAAGTVLSRVTGVGRVLVIPAVFGTQAIGDMFQAVNALPATIFATFGGQALSSMLVPVIVRALDKDPRRANKIGQNALAIVGIVAALIAFVGTLLYRPIGAALAFGVDDASGASQMASTLLLFVLPQIVLYGLIAVLVALQHARGRFLWPSIAPTIENIVLMVAIIVVARLFDDVHLATSSDTRILVSLGMASTVALLFHLVVQAWGARRAGAKISPIRPRREPELTALRDQVRSSFAWTVVFGARFVGVTIAAGWAGGGGIQAIQIGLLLANLPLALIGYPLAAATLPRLSRLPKGSDAIALAYRNAFNLVVWVLLPMAVGLVVLSGPLGAVLAVGRFAAEGGTQLVVAAIAGLAFSAVSEAAYEIARQASFAYGDVRGFSRSIVVRCVLSLIGIVLMPSFLGGPSLLLGLGLVISLSDVVAFVAIDWPLRRVGGPSKRLRYTAIRAAVGCAVAVAAVVALDALLLARIPPLARLVPLGCVFVATYFAFCWVSTERGTVVKKWLEEFRIETADQPVPAKPAAPKTEFRQLVLDDLPALTELHIEAFGNRDNSVEQIHDFYQRIMTRMDREVQAGTSTPSFGAVRNGKVIASLFTFAIPVQIDGESTRAAMATLLSTHPEHRATSPTMRLIKHVLNGPQSFTTADRVNRDGRRASQASGLTFYPQQSLRWSYVLAPGRAATAAVLSRRRSGGVGAGIVRGSGRVIDVLAPRVASRLLSESGAPTAALVAKELRADDLVGPGSELLDHFVIRPDFGDATTVTETWTSLEEVRAGGSHHRVGLWTPRGGLAGWFVMHVSPFGSAEVLQLVSTQRHAHNVLTWLFHLSEELGVGMLQGPVPLDMLIPLGEAGARFSSHNGSFGIHSKNPEIARIFAANRGFLSGLEGEYTVQLERGR